MPRNSNSSASVGIKPQACVGYFDALKFACRRRFNEKLRRDLRGHCQYLDVRRNSPPRDYEWVLTVVTPDKEALRALGEVPNLEVRSVEVALDMIVADRAQADTIWRLIALHFVQSWPGRNEPTIYSSTFYSGEKRRGRVFVAYADRPPKTRSASAACHVEARYRGRQALRQIRISAARDLLNFDHKAFWRKHLRLLAVDVRRLGRWHDNKVSGKRRRHHDVRQGKVVYDADHARGCLLFHFYGCHERNQMRSTQRFIARYKRKVAYMHEIDVATLLPS